MKNSLILTLVIWTLFSCSKKKDTLVHPNITEKVNPKSGIIWYGEKQTWMNGATSFTGISYFQPNSIYPTGNYFFSTTNDFYNFQIHSLPKPLISGGKFIIRYFSGSDIVATSVSSDSILAVESNDLGTTWHEKFRLQIYNDFGTFYNPDFISSYSFIEVVSFINKDEAVIYLGNSYVNKCAIYRISNNAATLVGVVNSFAFYFAKYYDFNNAIRFSDVNGVSKIFKSSDGGLNWTGPFSFPADFQYGSNDPDYFFKIQTWGNTIAVIMNNVKYISNNQGTTWTGTSFPKYFQRLYFISQDVGYAFGWVINDNFDSSGYYGSIYKTTDGGTSWSKVNEEKVYAYVYGMDFAFYDEQHGYLNSSEGFYATEDGGKNWKLLLYPFPYVK